MAAAAPPDADGDHQMHSLQAEEEHGPLLSLQGLQYSDLPSQEEQAAKRSRALENLRAYVTACGGVLPVGWECTMRFRITSRRHGRHGLTTDNYYRSPCGRTLRTHKQVAEFMGLQPAPPAAAKPRQLAVTAQRARALDDGADGAPYVSVTITRSAPAPSTTSGCCSGWGALSAPVKRTHTTMLLTDTAGCPAGAGADSHHQQQQQCASAITGAYPAGSAPEPPAPAAANRPPAAARRTKASLLAKLGGHSPSSSPSCSSMQSTTSQGTGVTAAGAMQLAQQQRQQQQQQQAMALRHAQARTAVARLAQPLPPPAQPADSTSSATHSACSSRAVCSSSRVAPPAESPTSARQQPQAPAAMPRPKRRAPPKQTAQQQLGPAAAKPKKPRQSAAWREALRQLATQRAAASGLLPPPAAPATLAVATAAAAAAADNACSIGALPAS